MFNVIACMAKKRGIGMGNKLPWIMPEELKYFKNVTSYNDIPNKKNVVIMGRNTYESIGKQLPNRHNMIVSKTMDGENVYTSLNKALEKAKKYDTNTWVIGGEQLYKESVAHPYLNKVYLSELDIDLQCDTFFPKFNGKLIKSSNIGNMEFTTKDASYEIHLPYYSEFYEGNKISNVNWDCNIYKNIDTGERDYLHLLQKVLDEGTCRETRNGSVRSLFGGQMKFNMEDNVFPLLTTKKMFMKGITKELEMFLNGITDSKWLEEHNVNIWKGNTTQEFINERGLDYEEGDMGPMYGFQWKHWGETYVNKDTEYKGYDQLENVIDEIIENPTSRRLLFTTYNPAEVEKSVLAPCHGLISQIYIEQKGDIREVSLQTYQRSADMFLGVPFNIASYGLLLNTLVEVLNNRDENGLYMTKELIINLGDCHIYSEHLEQCIKQLERIPNKFPKILFNKRINKLEDLNSEIFNIVDYNSHGKLKASMIS